MGIVHCEESKDSTKYPVLITDSVLSNNRALLVYLILRMHLMITMMIKIIFISYLVCISQLYMI